MPLDPCQDGCLNHNIPSNTVPVAGDDPCNTAGNGYFCQGSYWLYDPDEPGADTATNGDCPRLFLRNGGDCGVYQWIEIALASLITDTVAPVDGTDCCPPGTLWCMPAAGAVTVDQIWISTNGCGATPCTWCKLCGLGRTELFYTGTLLGIAEGVSANVPFDLVVTDFFNEATLPNMTLVSASGCYTIQAEAILDYNGINFEASLLRLELVVNGVPTANMGNIGGFTLNRPPGNNITMPITGTITGCWPAGTTLGISVNWNTNFGGTTIDLLSGWMRVQQIS